MVRALPKDGQYLIVGGPGTGKTVMALIRARRHHRDKDDHVFLVYNHLLHLASEQLFGGGLSSATWQTWLPDQFREITGDALPKKAAELSGFRPIDWDAVADVTRTYLKMPIGSCFPRLRPPRRPSSCGVIDDLQRHCRRCRIEAPRDFRVLSVTSRTSRLDSSATSTRISRSNGSCSSDNTQHMRAFRIHKTASSTRRVGIAPARPGEISSLRLNVAPRSQF